MTTLTPHFHSVDENTGEAFTIVQEQWPDTAKRVVDGNLAYVGPEHHNPGEREQLFAALHAMNILPAGRHLWVTGTDNRYSRNCFTSGYESDDLAEHFVWQFARLMEGGGVGANYSADVIGVMPPVEGRVFVEFVCDPQHPDRPEFAGYLAQMPRIGAMNVGVHDSREGWADAIRTVINSAATPGDHHIVIDVSEVRPKGAELKTMGGTASGPGPLVCALNEIAAVLQRAVGRRLDWRDCMDIDHSTAQAVVSGGVRRSARMSILNWADPNVFEFVSCKADHTSYWSTNISVEVDEDYFAAINDPSNPMHLHAQTVLDNVAEMACMNGEPGLFNAALANETEPLRVRATNPCGEQLLQPWEACSLGHVNLARFAHDPDGAEEMFRLMTRFLVRATMNTYPDPKAAEVEGRNRRIGVGFLGFQEWVVARGVRWSESAADPTTRRLLSRFREAVRDEADRYCDQLGIPRCVKVTTVAPTGTVSQMAGVTSGVHPILFRYFIRNVRYTDNDPQLPVLASLGYTIEDDIYARNTKVVSFPVKDPIMAALPYSEELIEQQDELTVDQCLAVQAMVQETWCGGRDGNAVSFTVNMPPSMDPVGVREALHKWLPHLKGTTLFPNGGERPQSPYIAISREFYLSELERLGLEESVGGGDLECKGGACPVR